MRIALDFDGVIHDLSSVRPGKRMGRPIHGALAGVTQLVADGHEVIVHTVRGDKPDHVKDWMRYFLFPDLEVTRLKPNADVYIDDKARRFIDWESFGEILYPEVWV